MEYSYLGLFTYPMTRAQYYFQTKAFVSDAKPLPGSLTSFYKGFSIYALKNLTLSSIGRKSKEFEFAGLIVLYPLEVLLVRSCAVGADSSINLRNSIKHIYNTSLRRNYLGFTMYALSCYFYVLSSLYFGVIAGIISIVPFDFIRRNYIIENFKSQEPISYRQVFQHIKTTNPKAFLSTIPLYYQLYVLPIVYFHSLV